MNKINNIDPQNKFADIKCHEMPNHFHCIIENVGADLCVCPNTKQTLDEQRTLGEHIGSPLHSVVQWFKTMSTNEYIRGVKTKQWQQFDGKLWQRNYWEHIIRDENSLKTISQYIMDNPLNWKHDELFIN